MNYSARTYFNAFKLSKQIKETGIAVCDYTAH